MNSPALSLPFCFRGGASLGRSLAHTKRRLELPPSKATTTTIAQSSKRKAHISCSTTKGRQLELGNYLLYFCYHPFLFSLLLLCDRRPFSDLASTTAFYTPSPQLSTTRRASTTIPRKYLRGQLYDQKLKKGKLESPFEEQEFGGGLGTRESEENKTEDTHSPIHNNTHIHTHTHTSCRQPHQEVPQATALVPLVQDRLVVPRPLAAPAPAPHPHPLHPSKSPRPPLATPRPPSTRTCGHKSTWSSFATGTSGVSRITCCTY